MLDLDSLLPVRRCDFDHGYVCVSLTYDRDQQIQKQDDVEDAAEEEDEPINLAVQL